MPGSACAGRRTMPSMPPHRRLCRHPRSPGNRWRFPPRRPRRPAYLRRADDIARLKVRLEHVDDPRQRRLLLNDITRLKARRRAELRRIADKLRAHDDLAGRLDLVLSIPGIGERTAIALVVRLPELGKISRGQIAALAGLAPFDADSGTHKGQRHIAGGRARVRRSLYAAALPAAFHWNPPLKAFYARLAARGKSHNATLTACARKLLIYANTVVSRQTPWTENPAEA